MNTNNAPERDSHPPLGRLLPMMSGRHCAMCGKSIPLGNRHYQNGTKPSCVLGPEPVPMQPQVNESDEAVAREIANSMRDKLIIPIVRGTESPLYEDPERVRMRTAIAHVMQAFTEVAPSILARHRQPAAVSADAVELRTILNRIDALIPDRDHLNGCSESAMRGYLHMILDQLQHVPDLSPETVCGVKIMDKQIHAYVALQDGVFRGATCPANSQAVQELVAVLREAYEVMESYCGEYGMGALEEASDKVEKVLAKYGNTQTTNEKPE